MFINDYGEKYSSKADNAADVITMADVGGIGTLIYHTFRFKDYEYDDMPDGQLALTPLVYKGYEPDVDKDNALNGSDIFAELYNLGEKINDFSEEKSFDHVSDTVEIYTDRIGAAHKNIGNYHLTHVNLVFDDYTKRLIQTLELIEHSPRIIDIDYMRYYNVRLNGICSYTEYEIDRVIRSIHYQHSTLVTFAELMKRAGFSVDILSKRKGA